MVLTETAIHSRYGSAFPILQEDFSTAILGLLNDLFTLIAFHMILLLIKKPVQLPGAPESKVWVSTSKGHSLS